MALIALSAGFWLVHRPRPSARPAATAASRSSLPPTEQALKAAVTRLPRDADAHRALARYLLDQHRPFEALWHFCAAQELNPADATTPIAVARALAQAGFADRARSLLRARLARSPSDLEARAALAEVALATARPQEALAVLSGTMPATSAPAQLLLGDARAAVGEITGARAAYRRAVALEPEGAAGYDRLGRLALAHGDWAEAKREFGAAREREPGDPGHGYRLGQAYWAAGQQAEAQRLWEEVAESSPDYAPAQLALGKVYRSRKDMVRAAAPLAAAVRADPASKAAQFALAGVMTALGQPAPACYQRGIYYLETDRPHLALQQFRRQAAMAPQSADGARMSVLACLRMKRLDLAAAEAERGLVRHPRDPQLLAQLALLHVLGHNRPRAQQLCEEWLKWDPNAAEPARMLARIAREEQRLPEALRYDEQALTRDPQNALVCWDLSKTLDAIGGPDNNQRAVELAQRATALNPNEADNWRQLGAALQAAGRETETADAFLRSLDLDPASVSSSSALVPIATRAGLPELAHFSASLATDLQNRSRSADLLWRAAYGQPDDPAAHDRLARFLLASGDLGRSDSQLEQIVALRPGDGAARRDLALVQRLLDLRGG